MGEHDDELRQLASIASHDLRSPLTALLLGARMLAREPGLGAVGRQAADELEEAAEDVERKVHALLDLARASHGGLAAAPAPLDLADLSAAAIRPFERKARVRSQRVELRTSGPVQVRGDAALVRRAIEALVEFALQHSPEGSQIGVEVSQVGDGGVARVIDAGPPLPDAASVFEPSTAADEGHRLAGLSLLFARAAALATGGRVWAESLPAGAAVSLWLPSP